jgi:glycosyltransferase involved in cell wall biosynthesis
MLPQACEPRDTIAKSEKRLAGDVLHFLHAGSFSLSDPDRHIGPVLDVLERAVADGVNVKLSLVGRLTENEAASATKRLGRRVAILGLKPRQRVLEMLDECDILILSTADNTNAVPGKLAEFRAAQKPIIVLGGGGWLQETDILREDALTIIRRVAEGRAVHLPSLPPTPVEVARLLVARLQ